MFLLAGVDQNLTTTNCAKYDFTNLTTTMWFVNATWYCQGAFNANCNQYKDVMLDTGMTDVQMGAFYDINVAYTFGWVLLNRTTTISTYYQCATPTNCTNNELAAL